MLCAVVYCKVCFIINMTGIFYTMLLLNIFIFINFIINSAYTIYFLLLHVINKTRHSQMTGILGMKDLKTHDVNDQRTKDGGRGKQKILIRNLNSRFVRSF